MRQQQICSSRELRLWPATDLSDQLSKVLLTVWMTLLLGCLQIACLSIPLLPFYLPALRLHFGLWLFPFHRTIWLEVFEHLTPRAASCIQTLLLKAASRILQAFRERVRDFSASKDTDGAKHLHRAIKNTLG